MKMPVNCVLNSNSFFVCSDQFEQYCFEINLKVRNHFVVTLVNRSLFTEPLIEIGNIFFLLLRYRTVFAKRTMNWIEIML